MKRALIAIAASAAVLVVGMAICATAPAMAQAAAPAVPAAATGGGLIDIGQAFGQAAAPYINALVNALILAGVTWLGNYLRQRFNVTIDQAHRDALVHALQNQAGSLIADGLVKIENGKVTVPSNAVTQSAAEVMRVIPDAAAHLGLTPDYVAKRIVDTIPQIAAGAQMIAAAQPKA